MIETISNWAGELVVALIVTTLIEMILPDNKTKKYVKTLIGVYIVFCIISPFINESQVLSFKNIEKEFESYSKELNIHEIQAENVKNSNVSMESLYIEEFRKDIIEKVKKYGYEVKQCDVDIEIDATKENAGINKIYVNIGKKQNQNDYQNQNTDKIKIDDIHKVEISINTNINENNNNVRTNENEDTLSVKKFLSEHYEISEDKVKVIQD